MIVVVVGDYIKHSNHIGMAWAWCCRTAILFHLFHIPKCFILTKLLYICSIYAYVCIQIEITPNAHFICQSEGNN